MKSYTDLEQSKKLAEILPLESADMQWFLEEDYGIVQIKEELQDWSGDCTIPCWSLTALFDVLPDGTDVTKDKSDTENEKYMCTVGIKNDIISTFADNPVDACVEMIIKLHERKLL